MGGLEELDTYLFRYLSCVWVVCWLPGHMVDDRGEVGGSVELN